MESWFADAKPIDSLEPEIAFQLRDELQTASFHRPEPLALPSFTRADRLRVRSAEAVGHEAELAAYYARVVALARQHGLSFDEVRQYFWIDLRLDDRAADVHLSFPWYDTFSAIDHVLRALEGPEEGLVYDDEDQGWAVEIWAREGQLYIRERDPDADANADELALMVTLPRAVLVPRIAALRARTQRLIAALASELGADVWTRGEAGALLPR